jgi:hypothetical protein
MQAWAGIIWSNARKLLGIVLKRTAVRAVDFEAENVALTPESSL